jgi:hypothetical protein
MSNIRYDIEEIKRNPLNRENARLLPEQLRYAQFDLHQAQRMPHATAKQEKAKKEAEENAQRVYDERLAKYNMYRECFPDLFQ